MLEGVGVTAHQEQIYRLLLRGAVSIGEISEHTGSNRAVIIREVKALRELGLVVRLTTRPAMYGAAQPDVALTALIHQREQQHEQTRSAVKQLMVDFAAGVREAPPGADIESLTATDAIMQRYTQLQLAAEDEVRIVDVPPYIITPDEPNPFELESLARGVHWRVIYDMSTFEYPRKWQSMQECVAAGEQARTLTGAPAKMHISDKTLAMVFPRDQDHVTSAVVVHPSPLLDSLLRLFDLMWEQATSSLDPGTGTRSGLTETETAVLSLLAAGEKDETIARLMGIHVRTVRRHVSQLCSKLGAPSRFVAGLRAAQRGWI